jgi:capsule polysaccharide export protein KpsE/RkpR
VEISGPAAIPIYEPSPEPGGRPEGRDRPEASSGVVASLRLLWREQRFLWRAALLAAGLSAVVVYSLPLHWKGVVKFVPSEGSGSMAMGGLLNRIANSSAASSPMLGLGLDAAGLLGSKTPGAFYVEVLKSQAVRDRMIDRFNLRTHYSRWAGLSPFFRKSRYDTRKKLAAFTDIDEDRKSGVITVTVTDYDQQMAAKIANAYIEELNRSAAELNTSDAHRERVFLEERLKGARQDLERASLELSEFSSKNRVMDPQTQSKAMMDAASRIQGELIVRESELRGLEQTYSNDSARVRSLRAHIGELQSQLKNMLGSSAATPVANGDAASGTVPYSMKTLPVLGSRYADLYRETKIQETVYEFLTQQLEMAKIQEAKELPTVRVMDPASPPEKKAGPFRVLLISVSAIVAFMLASAWVLGRATWQRIPMRDPRRLLMDEIASDVRGLARRWRRGSV